MRDSRRRPARGSTPESDRSGGGAGRDLGGHGGPGGQGQDGDDDDDEVEDLPPAYIHLRILYGYIRTHIIRIHTCIYYIYYV